MRANQQEIKFGESLDPFYSEQLSGNMLSRSVNMKYAF